VVNKLLTAPRSKGWSNRGYDDGLMIRSLDYWIGTRLFHPPIIWICQRSGATQWAIASYAWMMASFTLVMRARFVMNLNEVVFTAATSLIAIGVTLAAALIPDTPRQPSFPFRCFIWFLALMDVADMAFGRPRHGEVAVWWGLVWEVFALIGEYAKTIRTIPPRRRPDAHAGAFERAI
jgi:hypothetical protein